MSTGKFKPHQLKFTSLFIHFHFRKASFVYSTVFKLFLRANLLEDGTPPNPVEEVTPFAH